MEIKFNSLPELYNRLKPALIAKQREMIRKGYTYIEIENIWEYLRENRWLSSHNLTLADMVNDIMIASNEEIDKHLKDKFREPERKRDSSLSDLVRNDDRDEKE